MAASEHQHGGADHCHVSSSSSATRRRSQQTLCLICLILCIQTEICLCQKQKENHGPTAQDIAEQEQKQFLNLIFEKYGHEGKITFEGFEHLMESLGLANVKIRHAIHDHFKDGGQFEEFHIDHQHDAENGLETPTTESHKSEPTTTQESSTLRTLHKRSVNNTANSTSTTPSTISNSTPSTTEDVTTNDLDSTTTELPKTKTIEQQPDQQNHSGKATKPLVESPNYFNYYDSAEQKEKQLAEREKVENTNLELDHDHADHDHDHDHEHEHEEGRRQDDDGGTRGDDARRTAVPPEYKKCFSVPELLITFGQEQGITPDGFLKLCPAIVYQLDLHTCRNRPCPNDGYDTLYDHVGAGEHDHDHNDHQISVTAANLTDEFLLLGVPLTVWGFSNLSVLVISLVGLLGVAVVPLMQKLFYTHLIQFLVALAVGTLVGDALLHLLPHALSPHSHGAPSGGGDTHDHSSAPDEDHKFKVWKGLVALSGIYFFFLMERIMIIVHQRKRKSPKKKGKFRKLDENTRVGHRLSEHHVLYKSCEDIVLVVHDDGRMTHSHEKPSRRCRGHIAASAALATETPCPDDPAVHHLTLHSGHCADRRPSDDSSRGQGTDMFDDELSRITDDVNIESVDSKPTSPKPPSPVVVEDDDRRDLLAGDSDHKHHKRRSRHSLHDDGHHGNHHHDDHEHGEAAGGKHGHGHSHALDEMPTTVAAVAWMVILGDGLHNFSDGLAIGAAFANSISGGVSTSVAVFCHELPHELGDFAMLLAAGMSVKQALVYNMISSVLCFLGMFIGVSLGNISEASVWIFALAAGMFIYIALVDMLPELSSDSHGAIPRLFLHNAGLLCGMAVMLLIAIFEDKITFEL